MGKPNGYVIYAGPSLLLNSKHISVISTGLFRRSDNPKTGPMMQVFIMPTHTDPVTAGKNGDDFAVCGDCKLRTILVLIKGKWKQLRKCYVTLFQAPRAVWAALKRGRYPRLKTLDEVSWLHAGEAVRLGAWGDPAAMPFEITAATALLAKTTTGYTHQFVTCDQRLKEYIMASVDTEEEYAQAKRMGWRTFRTRTIGDPMLPNEINCPASAEAGHRTTCHDCGLCNGIKRADTRKDITILVHGNGTKLFTGRLLPMLST